MGQKGIDLMAQILNNFFDKILSSLQPFVIIMLNQQKLFRAMAVT